MANTKKDKIKKAVAQKTRRKSMKSDDDPNTAQVNLNTEILKKAKLALAEMSKTLKVTQKEILEILILNTYEELLDYSTKLKRKGLSEQEIASIFTYIEPQNIKITLIQVGNSHPRSNAFDPPRNFQKNQSDIDSLLKSISDTNNTPSQTDTQNTNAAAKPDTEETITPNPLNQQEIEPSINVQLDTANVSPSQPTITTIRKQSSLVKIKPNPPFPIRKKTNNNDYESDNDSVSIPTKE